MLIQQYDNKTVCTVHDPYSAYVPPTVQQHSTAPHAKNNNYHLNNYSPQIYQPLPATEYAQPLPQPVLSKPVERSVVAVTTVLAAHNGYYQPSVNVQTVEDETDQTSPMIVLMQSLWSHHLAIQRATITAARDAALRELLQDLYSIINAIRSGDITSAVSDMVHELLSPSRVTLLDTRYGRYLVGLAIRHRTPAITRLLEQKCVECAAQLSVSDEGYVIIGAVMRIASSDAVTNIAYALWCAPSSPSTFSTVVLVRASIRKLKHLLYWFLRCVRPELEAHAVIMRRIVEDMWLYTADEFTNLFRPIPNSDADFEDLDSAHNWNRIINVERQQTEVEEGKYLSKLILAVLLECNVPLLVQLLDKVMQHFDNIIDKCTGRALLPFLRCGNASVTLPLIEKILSHRSAAELSVTKGACIVEAVLQEHPTLYLDKFAVEIFSNRSQFVTIWQNRYGNFVLSTLLKTAQQLNSPHFADIITFMVDHERNLPRKVGNEPNPAHFVTAKFRYTPPSKTPRTRRQQHSS